MSAELKQADVDRVLKNLTRVFEEIDDKKTKRAIMQPAAKPIIDAAKANAPVRNPKWPEVVHRYKKRKSIGLFESRKKKSQVVASYWRGNLRRSIVQLALRRAVKIILGPKIGNNPSGDFKGRKVDGYYAQMIYGSAKAFRAKVMEPALNSGQGEAISIASREIKNLVPKLAKKYGFE